MAPPLTAPTELFRPTKIEGPKTTPFSEIEPEGPCKDPQVGILSDEYNADDEPEDGQELSYGWGYEDALDDPETANERPSATHDEDEAYASDPKNEKKQ